MAIDRPNPRRNAAAAAKQRQALADKLPLDREKADALIDEYLVPLMKRAGMGVRVRRMGGTRTIVAKLPK